VVVSRQGWLHMAGLMVLPRFRASIETFMRNSFHLVLAHQSCAPHPHSVDLCGAHALAWLVRTRPEWWGWPCSLLPGLAPLPPSGWTHHVGLVLPAALGDSPRYVGASVDLMM
jgi:hypothetical protein